MLKAYPKLVDLILWSTIAILVYAGVSAGIIPMVSAVNPIPLNVDPTPVVTASPSPSPTPFTIYQPPHIQPAHDYHIFFMGDSMTKALGPHTSKFSTYINRYYPDHSFQLDNYAVGSTNVLSIPLRLNQDTTVEGDEVLPPLLNENMDIIIIESFGHNPLSTLPREEGRAKQREMLDQTMKTLMETHPNTLIMFLATLGPHPKWYASTLAKRTPEETEGWARERKDYIENHINYAKEHQIPLINVYEAAKTPEGEVDLKYINHDDYIHPSEVGVDLISKMIADYIKDNNILPEEVTSATPENNQ